MFAGNTARFALAAGLVSVAMSALAQGQVFNPAPQARPYGVWDAGQEMATKLRMSNGSINVAVLGDSTGNQTNEWVYLAAQSLGTNFPALRVNYYLWASNTTNYDAAIQIQAGSNTTGGVLFQDLFNRTTSELNTNTPDVGAVWGRDGSSAAGNWTVNGSQAVRSTNTTNGTMLADGASPGSVRLTVPFTMATVPTNTAYTAQFTIKRLSSSNRLLTSFSVATNGTTTWSILKQINGSNTTLQSATLGSWPATNTNSGTLVFSAVTTNVSATLGTNSLSGTLTASDWALLEPATVTGITANANTRMVLDSWTVDQPTTNDPQTVNIWNASVAGTTTEYQRPLLRQILSTRPDLVIVNTGHNWAGTVATNWQASLDNLVNDIYRLHPTAGLAFASQNPQKSPAANRVSHLQRQLTLRGYAQRAGAGYIPVLESWQLQTNAGTGLIDSDGVHPTTGTNSGSTLWAARVFSYWTNLMTGN